MYAVAPAAVARARASLEPLITMIGVSFVACVLTEPLAVEQPVDSRQPDIEHDRIRGAALHQALRLDHMVGLCDPEPVELERRPYEIADGEIIVDNKNVLSRQRGTSVRSFTLPLSAAGGIFLRGARKSL